MFTDLWILGTCPPIPGLTSTLKTDFTKLTSSLNKDWTVASDEPFSTSSTNGAVISMQKRGDAPYIWTSSYFQYGHVEVILQTAPGVGVITSAVLLSDTADEIDIEFSGNNYDSTPTAPTFQTNYFGKGIAGNYDRSSSMSPGFDMTAGFHTYSLDWMTEKMTWSIDGKAVRTLPRADCDGGAHQYPQTPAQFHVGVWDSGDSSNNPGIIQQVTGGQTDVNGFPYTAYVKSVRIVPASSCAYYNYTDTSGSDGSVECLSALHNTSSIRTSTSRTMSIGPRSLSTGSQAPSSIIETGGGSNSSAKATSSAAVDAAASSVGSDPVPHTTSTVYKTSVYSTVTSCNPSVMDCPAEKPHASTVVVTDIVIDFTTICPVTESETTPPKASSGSYTTSNDTMVPVYASPIPLASTSSSSSYTTSKDVTVPVYASPVSPAPSSSLSSYTTSNDDTVPVYASPILPASSSSSTTSLTSSNNTVPVYASPIPLSLTAQVSGTSSKSSSALFPFPSHSSLIPPKGAPETFQSNKTTVTVSSGVTSTEKTSESSPSSTFKPPKGAPETYLSSVSTVTVTSGVTTTIETSDSTPSPTFKPPQGAPETYSSGPTTVTVSSGMITTTIHLAAAAPSDTGSDSASMSIDFSIASPSLCNIDTETPNSAAVPSSSTPSANSPTPSQPSGQTPSKTSSSSSSSAALQPVPSSSSSSPSDTSPVHSTVTLTTTSGILTALTVYSTSETVIPTCAPGMSGTHCLGTISTTVVVATVVVTPVTAPTPAPVPADQPPAADQSQGGGGGGQDGDGQTGVTGNISSSGAGGSVIPPSGKSGVVAETGARIGAGMGTLEILLTGPSSTGMSTVQTAGSGRVFGSGRLLKVVGVGVVPLLHLGGAGW